MRTACAVVAVLSVAGLGLTACGRSSNASNLGSSHPGHLVDGKTFTMGIATDPGNLDPLMSGLGATIEVDRFLYASLLNFPNGRDAVSGLAGKWDATTTTASFTLRPGLTCSDGTPLTASDVAGSINFVSNPKNQSPLVGVQVMPGTKASANDAARTVSVTSGAPDAFLLHNIGTLPIVCAKGLTDPSLLAKGGAGSGMFTLTEAVSNNHYTLTQRPGFTSGPGDWRPNLPGLPAKVVIKVIANESTAANLLLSNDLNAATINGSDQQRLQGAGLFHADQQGMLGEFVFNQARGRSTSSQPVRLALLRALDLAQVGQVMTGGRGKPPQGMITPPSPCTGNPVSGNVPVHDVAAAKAGLAAAGWSTGSGGPLTKNGTKLSLTLLYATELGPNMASAAELVQQQWKAVGIDVKISGLDSTGVQQVLFQTGSWDVLMTPIGEPLPSQLVPLLSGPVPPHGTNFAHIQNKQYDELVKKASTQAGATGCSDWNAAESALIKASDAVPFVDSVQPTFGRDAKFAVDGYGIYPYSIRMYD